MPPVDDSILVRQAQAGDSSAFDRLVEQYFGLVYSIGLARLCDRESAEDLAQEVFLRAFIHLADLRDPRFFAPWISRAARNLAADWNLKSQRRSRLLPVISNVSDTRLEQAPDLRKGVYERMTEESENQALHRAIWKLPEQQRELILLHYMEGMSKAEIAQRLNVHPSTVGRQLDRGLELLRGILDPVLRRTLRHLRPSPKALPKTLGLLGTLAAMDTAARAQLLAAAAWKEGAAIFSAAQTAQGLSASSSSLGGALGRISRPLGELLHSPTLLTKAAVTSAGILAIVALSFFHDRSSSPPPPPPSEKAESSAPAPASTLPRPSPETRLRGKPAAASAAAAHPVESSAFVAEPLPDLPEGYQLYACQCSQESSFGTHAQNSAHFFYQDGMNLPAAIHAGWGISAGRIRSELPLEGPNFIFLLQAPADTPARQFQSVLRTEIQRAFEMRVRLESQVEHVLVLTAPLGLPEAFRPSASSDLPILRTLFGGHATGKRIADFAEMIEREIRLPVVEETGLDGHFDFAWRGDAHRAATEDFGFVLEPDVREFLFAIVVSAPKQK